MVMNMAEVNMSVNNKGVFAFGKAHTQLITQPINAFGVISPGLND